MVNLPLLNFIVYNFYQSHIVSVAFFHCWNEQTQNIFVNMVNNDFMYTQFVNIDAVEFAYRLEYRFFNHKRPTLGVFLDMSCNRSTELIALSSQLRLFGQHYHWLLYDQSADITNFRDLFADISLSIDADLTYAIDDEKPISDNATATYVLYDVYNNGRLQGGRLNMTVDRSIICTMQKCRLGQYLSKLHLRPKYGNRNRMRDVVMRVATVVTKRPITLSHKELQEYLISENNTRIDSIVRFGFQLLMLLKDMLECKLNQTYTDRWSTNETHGGSVGAIVTEQADIASSPFLNTAGRQKYCAVLAETGGFRSICLFRTPIIIGIHGDVFLKPFSGTVWLLFAVFLAIAAIFLWSTFIVENRRMRNYLGYMPSLLTTSLISFGSACVQGSNVVPLSVGGRVAFFSLYLISFIMYNYYTSIVVSSLLGTPVKSNIKTVGQLADSSLEVGIEPLPFTFVYLNTSKLADVRRFVQRKIFSRKNPESVWMPPEEGIIRVRDNPGFVYVFEASTGYSLIEKFYRPHEICDINEFLLRPETGVYTQVHKNSTYKELFRLRHLRMLETGVYAKHFRHWVQVRLNCFASNVIISVGLEYTAPLFLLLLIAYIAVSVILMMEIAYKRYADGRKASVYGIRRKKRASTEGTCNVGA